jgi:DNA-binding transcriptional ArsR family regulator
MQLDLAVVTAAAQAAALLDPVRARLLEHLREPDSAAGAARVLGLPRQRLGYHVRELERAGLLVAVGERKQRNCIERLLQATARRYVISPTALGGGHLSAETVRDRFSSEYLVASASRVVQDVGTLQQLAKDAGKKLPTLTVETDVRFATPQAQHAFATELAECMARLVEKYHDNDAPHGRRFTFLAVGHPSAPRVATTPRSPAPTTSGTTSGADHAQEKRDA